MALYIRLEQEADIASLGSPAVAERLYFLISEVIASGGTVVFEDRPLKALSTAEFTISNERELEEWRGNFLKRLSVRER